MSSGSKELVAPRTRALAGAAGPALFITSWVVAGAIREGYDPIDMAISRLFELEADNRWIVIAGNLAFAAGCALFAPLLARPARVALFVTSLAAIAVVVFPCETGCPRSGSVLAIGHTVSAGILYLSLTLTPVLHSRSAYAIATSAIAGCALALQGLGAEPGGLFQRIGLTVDDLWLIVTALGLLGSTSRPGPREVLHGGP